MNIENTASSEAIADLFAQASKNRQAVLVKGYVSSSGSVKDITVLTLPPGGYADMVRMSHTLLESNELDQAHHSEEAWSKAREARLTSWEKFKDPNNEPPEDSTPKSKYKLKHVAGSVFEATDAPGTSVVSQLSGVAYHSLFEPEKKASTKPKDPVSAAKEHLDGQVPLDEYIGQLILNREKFQGAELVEAPKDSWTYKLFYCCDC